MEIIFTKSFWELDLGGAEDPLRTYMERVAASGFDGTEMFLLLVSDPPDRVAELHEEFGLRGPILDIVTEGDTPAEHRDSFDRALERAATYRPTLINSHTGRDIFSFDANVALFEHAVARAEEVGIDVVHETHRFRPTYSAVETRRYLEAVAGLMLNADLSHWMVVHESDLSDQPENVDAALKRSRHIHARVGFEEGPQINDPSSPEWSDHVARHVELWRSIAGYCREAGIGTLAVTPEFGPPPYAPTAVGTGEPLSDVWSANVFMKDLLKRELA